MNKGIRLLFTIIVLVISISVVSAKTHKCETVDGAYFGKDGNEVDKVQYEKECIKHSCEIVGDTYYDKDGNEVSEKTFEKECNVDVVSELPDTNSTLKYILIIIGSIFILGTIIFGTAYRLVSDRR